MGRYRGVCAGMVFPVCSSCPTFWHTFLLNLAYGIDSPALLLLLVLMLSMCASKEEAFLDWLGVTIEIQVCWLSFMEGRRRAS